MAALHVLIVKTGRTIEANRHRGEFEDWIAAGLRLEVRTVDAEREELPHQPDAVVVTGSPASVTARAPWMLRTERWLGRLVELDVPLLGICFGHQMLATALGGQVITNPRGREIGTQEVRLLPAAKADPLLGMLAPRRSFRAQTSHSDTVSRLPEGAVLLAESDLDACQAFRARADRAAWGVQFHPEFDAEITRGYVRERAAALRSEGLDPGERLAGIAETPESASVLTTFAQLVSIR